MLLIQYYNTCTAYAIYTFHTDYYYISVVCVRVFTTSFLTWFFLLLLLLPKVATVFTGCNLRQRFPSNFSSSGGDRSEAKDNTRRNEKMKTLYWNVSAYNLKFRFEAFVCSQTFFARLLCGCGCVCCRWCWCCCHSFYIVLYAVRSVSRWWSVHHCAIIVEYCWRDIILWWKFAA